MNELTHAEIRRLLGVRGPMSDLRMFVGRDTELNMLEGVMQAPHNCAWIYGAPKNGKSSLARKVQERAESEGKKQVRFVNAMEIAPTDFEGLLRAALPGPGKGAGEPAEKAFTSFVRDSESRPPLIIFDNFDAHAIQLGLEQQRFLRSKKETYSYLNYLFVTRLDPNRIMEDVADEGSRLLSICGIQVPVPVLTLANVRQLCRLVTEAFGWSCYREWTSAIMARVGGNPGAVVETLSSFVQRSAGYPEAEPPIAEITESTVRATLKSHWRGLPSACRVFLLGTAEGPSEKAIAMREGYWNGDREEAIRPELLLAIGRPVGMHDFEPVDPREGGAPVALTLMSELHELIDSVNRLAGSSGDVFEINNETLRYHPVAREIRSENGLRLAVEHLAKVLHDGARRSPGGDPSASAWRIADEDLVRRYMQSNGMRMLLTLRRHYYPSPDEATALASRDEEASDWFERACDARAPAEPKHFDRVRMLLLRSLGAALRGLYEGMRTKFGAAVATAALPATAAARVAASGTVAPRADGEPVRRILHLSDLHFSKVEPVVVRYSQLVEDLHQQQVDKVDALVVSGDLVQSADPEEYAGARSFLERLASDFGLSPRQVVLVPGNHDTSWRLARQAYHLHYRHEYAGNLVPGSYFESGSDVIGVRNEDAYRERLLPFANLYRAIKGAEYPLAFEEQGIIDHLPDLGICILGLNSAWEADHHFHDRASIHPAALSNALLKLRALGADVLRIAVFHHPVSGDEKSRIQDMAFLQRLAVHGFHLALHGHIHRAAAEVYRYDHSVDGRQIEIVAAGTFGAPTKAWVPGYPLQYNLLLIEPERITVETRCRREPEGAWEPDARWRQGPGKDPLPRYTIERPRGLAPSGADDPRKRV